MQLFKRLCAHFFLIIECEFTSLLHNDLEDVRFPGAKHLFVLASKDLITNVRPVDPDDLGINDRAVAKENTVLARGLESHQK